MRSVMKHLASIGMVAGAMAAGTSAHAALIMPTGDRANTVVLAFRTPVRRWPIERLKARTSALDARFDLNFTVLLKDLTDHSACAARS